MNAANRPVPWPRLLRQIHLWLGVFFAPSILFFAVTGGLQELKFHEAHGDYKPPPVLEKLGQVHIHQKFELKPQRKPPAAKPGGPEAAGPQAAGPGADAPKPAKPPEAQSPEAKKGPPKPSASVAALRWFFVATSAGLVFTTLLGLWIGVVQARSRTVPLLLLAAGAVIPVLLLAL